MRCDVEILHYFAYYFASVALSDLPDRGLLIELEVFYSFEDLYIHFLLYNLPFENGVRLKRLVVSNVVVHLVDLINCLIILLLNLSVVFFLFLYLIQHRADCEVNLPKYALQQICHYSHNNNMHEDKQCYDVTIFIRFSKAVTPGVDGPATLSKDLHEKILGVDKCLKIRKLIEIVVVWVCIQFFFSIEKYFHAQDAKDEESKGKQMKEFDNDRHHLHESREYSFDIFDY